MKKSKIDLIGAAALVAFSLLMGLNQPLVKLVNAALDPVLQAGLRSLCAFPFVLGFAAIAGKRLSLRDGSAAWGVLAGLLFSAEFALLFEAVEHTDVSRTVILFYTMPFWVALAAHFLIPGERLTPRRGLGLCLALIGVALALADQSAAPASWRGDLMALTGAGLWALITLTARLTPFSRAGPEMQLLYQLGVSAVALTGFALISAALGPEGAVASVVREPSGTLLGVFVFQVTVVVAFGFLLFFWALSIYPASDMAAFSFLAPVFGVIASALILGESLSPAVIGALALIALGIFLVSWRPSAKRC